MNAVPGRFIPEIPVFVAQVAVHVDIKNIPAIGESGDRLVSLHDGGVVEDRV